jgi:amidase
LPAVRLAKMIAAGEASSEVVTRSFVDAIRAREKEVQAFAWFDADRAIAVARELHLVSRRGPLHGLPVGIKDNIDTADMPTGYGSIIYEGHRPHCDAACVGLLKNAGAFVIGKTISAELANFTPGPTRNPHHLEHTPGGSSSGSAAAVAAHFAPVALGTQTAGSVIRPAAYCGVVGYKPSPRLVPRSGAKPNSDTLDEIGTFARSVEDTGFVASVLTAKPAWREIAKQGRDGGAPALGWTATAQRAAGSDRMLANLESANARLRSRGARPADVTWPRVFDGLFEAQRTVQVYETARALGPEYAYRKQRLSARMVELIEHGFGIAAEDYVAALQLGRACAAAIDSLFGAADVVLAPSAPGEAPAGITATGDPVFNRPWQLIGCPVVHLPYGKGETGLPLGISVIARPGDDARLLAASAWIEAKLRD